MIKEETVYISAGNDTLQIRVCEDQASPRYKKIQIEFPGQWMTIDEAVGLAGLLNRELCEIIEIVNPEITKSMNNEQTK